MPLKEDKDDKKSKYNGHIASCMRHGDGAYDYPGGSYKYNGDWVYGVKNGSNGKFTLPGLFTYEGEFLNGEITGKGIRKWVDGRVYSGEWLNGEMHGTGTWQNANATEIYEGHYDNNKRQGNGILTIRGDVYKGKFSNNIYEGMGIYLRERKYVLECNFIKGICQGIGSVTWNKLATFEGKFRNGLPYEHGLFTAADDSMCYLGNISNSALGTVSTAIRVDCDPSQQRKKAMPSAVTGGAPPPAAKKGAPANDAASTALPVFGQGEWCGNMLLFTGSSEAIAAEDSDKNMLLPAPCEISRTLFLSLVPVPNEELGLTPTVEADCGDITRLPLRLWQRKHTLNSLSQSWARFPSTVCRVVGGVNKLTGRPATASTQSTNYLPPNPEQDEDQEKDEDAVTEVMVDVFGVECHRLCNTCSSINDLAVTFLPLKHFLQESWSTEASFVVDFRLDLWQFIKQLQKYIIKQKRAATVNRKSSSRGSASGLRSPSRLDLLDDDGSSSVTSRGGSRSYGLARAGSRADIGIASDDGSSGTIKTKLGRNASNSDIGDVTSPNSRGRLHSRDGLHEAPVVNIEVPIMRIEYTSESDMADWDHYLQLVMLVPNNDSVLVALFDKITDITENKIALEKQRVAQLQKIEEDRVKAAEAEAEKLLREATGEEEAPAPKKKASRKGRKEAPAPVVEEPIVIMPLVPSDVTTYSTTVMWELRMVPKGQGDSATSYAVLSKWQDNSFNVLTWHSISLTLRDVTVPTTSPLVDGHGPSSELYIDGHGKVKQDITQERMSLMPVEGAANADTSTTVDHVSDSVALSVVVPKTDSLIAEWLNSANDLPPALPSMKLDTVTPMPQVEGEDGGGAVEGKGSDVVVSGENELKTQSSPVIENSSVAGTATQSVGKSSPRNIQLTAGGSSFSGYVKLLAVYNKWHHCAAKDITACFDQFHADNGLELYWDKLLMNNPDDVGICKANPVEEAPVVETPNSKPTTAPAIAPLEKHTSVRGGTLSKQASTVLKSVGKKGATEDVPAAMAAVVATPAPVPSGEYPLEKDCVAMDAVPVICRGGRCEITQLVIPPDTPPGVYTLVVKDGVNSDLFLSSEVETVAGNDAACVAGDESSIALTVPATGSTGGPIFPGVSCLASTVALPSQLDNMYKVVRRLPDSRTTKIIVSSELMMP